MNVFDLSAKLTLDSSEYDKGLNESGQKASTFGDKLKKGFAIAGKAVAAGIAAAGTAAVAVGKQALEAYANYEQLVGGVETLFGAGGKSFREFVNESGLALDEATRQYSTLQKSQNTVLENAANAYKTAGMSANEYMETVTSFSASLLQSLGGDTAAAAEYADMAIRDMSDNANKMGTDMSAIQVAYQGFAKQNYTMLDNLKLGYGGTKTEMERLIADAEALDSSFVATRDANGDLAMSYADIVDAIHVVQTSMGITGTTAKEASTTISGSVSSMKSAWQNLLVGIADDNANFEGLVDNFVDSVVTAGQNIIPRVQSILGGLGKLIEEGADKFIPVIVDTVITSLPQFIKLGMKILNSLSSAIIANLPSLATAAIDIMMTLTNNIIQHLPEIISAAGDILMALVNGITAALPTLIPAIVDVVLTIVEKLTDPDTVTQLLKAALQIMLALAKGLIAAIPKVVAAVPRIITNIVNTIKNAGSKLLSAGRDLIARLASGISSAVGSVVSAASNIVNNIRNKISEAVTNARNWGRDMLQNFINGITEKISALWQKITDVTHGIKQRLGFSEPEIGPLSNFHTYAPDMMELFAKGIEDNKKMVFDAVSDAFDFGDVVASASVPIESSPGYGVINNTVNVYPQKGQSEEEIARAVERIFVRWHRQRKVALA